MRARPAVLLSKGQLLMETTSGRSWANADEVDRGRKEERLLRGFMEGLMRVSPSNASVMSILTSAKARVSSRSKRDSLFDIKIDRHFQSKVYTSGSGVSGCVTIAPQSDLPFRALEVILTGATSTHVHMLQHDVPPQSYTFLQLDMPIPEDILPQSRVLEAGSSYIIPFAFVIPHQLPSASCKHRSAVVHDRHLRLPPTIGTWEHDDLTIHSVRVDYAVRVRLVTGTTKDGKPKSIESRHKIRVLPLVPEEPPLLLSPGNPMYRFSDDKLVRKDLISSKVGHLKASTTQPDPVVLSVDKLQTSSSSMIVHLEFTPTSATPTPPNIQARSATIQAITHYSLGHIGYLPDQHRRPPITDSPTLPFFMHNEMDLNQPGKLVWEKRQGLYSMDSSRRSSEATNYSQERAESLPSTESSWSSRGDDIVEVKPATYRATLVIPFSLPTAGKKLFLPTFYSCLVCRNYTIRLTLGVGSHGTTLSLTVPLQIAAGDYSLSPTTHLPDYTPLAQHQNLDNDTLPAYEHVVQ
ncbi:hypothetical protein ACJ41O_012795 [Fusarium nematophilum]